MVPAARRRRAKQRIDQFQTWLAEPSRSNAAWQSPTATPLADLDVQTLAPQFAVPGPRGLTSTFSAAGYQGAVQRAIEYIYAGDIFQVNLAQRLLYPAAGDALALYLRLRQCNPATFAAWFDLGSAQLSAPRPNVFQRAKRAGRSPAHQGTRRRTAWAEADLFAGDELLESEKDWAENVMIVDLLRNDLSRV
jgi:para-aminobenzoate synthetase component 1